jgi:hypothetical protein
MRNGIRKSEKLKDRDPNESRDRNMFTWAKKKWDRSSQARENLFYESENVMLLVKHGV